MMIGCKSLQLICTLKHGALTPGGMIAHAHAEVGFGSVANGVGLAYLEWGAFVGLLGYYGLATHADPMSAKSKFSLYTVAAPPA